MDKRQTMEILAPAGSRESVVAAVQCGANAVYMGAKALNARRNAENFDDDAFCETVSYCHARNVKVYMTVNTMVMEEELPTVRETLQLAARAGVDALIIQDLGVARLAKELCPQIPRHASTQMSIHNLWGARLMEEMGFSRVVLAREMSREEIAEVCRQTNLEVEVFVHGALCMCVSGQCTLSAMIGERSGNRGLCAQPCRLPFSANGSQAYALSLKDVTLVDHLQELGAAGVTSLKIEGRMKRPEYVAAAVTACKQAMAGDLVDYEQLRAIFSRSGFTDGYFTGRRGKWMFGTRQKEDVTGAAGVLKELAGLYRKEMPLVPVNMELTMEEQEPVTLRAWDLDGHEALAQGEAPQKAISRPTDEALARRNLGKTGGTYFYLQDLTCHLQEGLMVPASLLNDLRRQVLDTLDRQRQELRPWPFLDQPLAPVPQKLHHRIPMLRVRCERKDQLSTEMLEKAQQIQLPVRECLLLLEQGFSQWEKVAAELPAAVFSNQERLVENLKKLQQAGLTQVVAQNLGAVWIAKQLGLAVSGGFRLNLANSAALKQVSDWGLQDATLSFEPPLGKLRQVGSILPVGLVAYGRLPLMLMRNCPVKCQTGCSGKRGSCTLTDRLGNQFPVLCQDQATELLNTVPLYLADRLSELENFDFLTLYFTLENPQQCAKVWEEYNVGGEKPHTPITRGLYYRNLL